MFAALLNVHTGEVVKRAFQQHHMGCLKVTDNQIVLHWISNGQELMHQDESKFPVKKVKAKLLLPLKNYKSLTKKLKH